jgi:hypothetical protein
MIGPHFRTLLLSCALHLAFTSVEPLPSARVIFVKTHKTGGSTVATILHCYARRSRAAIFVPPVGYDAHLFNLSIPSDRHVVGEQRRMQLTMSPPPPPPPSSSSAGNAPGMAQGRLSYHMWTSHAVYHSSLHALVPGALLLTIVREPSRRWLSAWQFYGVARRKGLERHDANSTSTSTSTSTNTNTNTSIPLPGSSSSLSSSSSLPISAPPVEIYIDAAWHRFRTSGFTDLLAADGDRRGLEPSQWSFSGTLQELAGGAHPSATLADAQTFADKVRQGRWRASSHRSVSGRGGGGGGGGGDVAAGSGASEVGKGRSSRRSSNEWAADASGEELVMVLERLDESLVALARLLGLPAAATAAGGGALHYVKPMNAGGSPHPLSSSETSTSPPNSPLPADAAASGAAALSSRAQLQLSDLVVADALLYRAADERLSALLQRLLQDDGDRLLQDDGDGGNDDAESPDSSALAASSSAVPAAVTTFKAALEATRRSCAVLEGSKDKPTSEHVDNEDRPSRSPAFPTAEDCLEMQRSDAEWSRRLNADLAAAVANASSTFQPLSSSSPPPSLYPLSSVAAVRKPRASCALRIFGGSIADTSGGLVTVAAGGVFEDQGSQPTVIPFPCAIATDYAAPSDGNDDDAVDEDDDDSDILSLDVAVSWAPLGAMAAPFVSLKPLDGCQSDGEAEAGEGRGGTSTTRTAATVGAAETAAFPPSTPQAKRIAIVERGGCSFGTKATAAQGAGFAALIITDRSPPASAEVDSGGGSAGGGIGRGGDTPWGGAPSVPALGTSDARRVKIPILLVSHAVGRLLHAAALPIAALAEGPWVDTTPPSGTAAAVLSIDTALG